MNLKGTIKSILNLFRPVKKTYAQIVQLAPSELLRDKTALITGGTSGIGFEIAKAYINAGATVVITGRNREKLLAAEKLLNQSGKGKCYSIQLDNTKIDSFKSKFEEALTLLEGKPLNILVNNAGVLGCHISNGTEDEYNAVLDTNLKGVFFLSQIVGHYFKDNNIQGNILNIASSSSLRPAASAYTLSKWGIRGLTIGLAKTFAPFGVTVNGLAPGQTATPMLRREDGDLYSDSVPLKRMDHPCEIANMAVILVSDMGRSIMGDIIYMTGGAGVFSNDDMNYTF